MSNYSYSEIDISYLADGNKLTLPVHELKGDKDGPTIGVSATIHGDEITGIEIIRQVVEYLKNKEMRGKIKLLPLSNPLAFSDSARKIKIDGGDLDKAFPGTDNGTITEQIAFHMGKLFIDDLDVYIDIHAGGNSPIVDYVGINNSEELSLAFGAPVLYRIPKGNIKGMLDEFMDASTIGYAQSQDILSVLVELGGGSNNKKYIETGVTGILNILRYKKMIDGDLDLPPKQTIIKDIINIRPKHGGIMVPTYAVDKMHQIIEGKQVLAKIYNPKTLELIDELETPHNQNLITLLRGEISKVHAGDFSFQAADYSKAEIIENKK